MGLFKNKSADSWARERLFAEKYDWLLSCALRLVNGDRAAAEDLVQESYLQFILAKLELKSTENIEPLLYTNLKFVYLAYLRRLQRYPSEPLPLAQYDFLELALRANASVANRVEVQNTLRRIVAYVCWRKEFAKSASLMILRYFHGYYPDEIARIAQTTPTSTRKQLHEGREEASLYASSSGRLRIIRQPEPPELIVPYSTVPSDQLVPELRSTIFAARRTECLSEDALHKRYQKQIPISRELLAHIVSCERCLNLVNQFCGTTPPTDRYLEETLGRDQGPRSKSKKDASMSSDISRTLHLVRKRFRDVYEHEPRQLNIVINGAVLATQDVSSTWNRLEVRLGSEVKPEYIQVISEQDICLLAMHVESTSSEVQQEIHHEIDLSNGRQIRARVRFTVVGPLVQVAYYAPEEATSSENEYDSDEAEDAVSTESASKPQDSVDKEVPFSPWWSGLWAKVPWPRFPEINPVFAIATSLALAVVLLVVLWPRIASKPSANDLLVRAVAAHTEGTTAAQPGVICQKVRIRTSKRTLERTIYRDAQGRRQPKAQDLSAEDAQLQTRLTTADVAWDNPLSPVNYKVWRDSGLITQDQVTRTGDGLLTLTTTAASGAVARESLTIRERDFHPVDRTVEFRDAETVEIAEVDYSVLPWGTPTDPFFDPPSRHTVSDAAPIRLPLLPLTTSELDEAELQTRLVLNQLHADTDGRIEVLRKATGIQVNGIVETDQRKRELEARLTPLSNVRLSISTFHELEAHSATRPSIAGINLKTDTDQPSPLKAYLQGKGWSPEKINDLSWQLLDSSIAVRSEGIMLADLSSRFATDSSLSVAGQIILSQLVANHRANLLSALQQEDKLLAEINLPQALTGNSMSPSEGTLVAVAQQNHALCADLTAGVATDGQNHAAELKMLELQQSITQTRAAVLRTAGDFETVHRYNAQR